MAIVTINPTAADKRIANAIAAHTTPGLEKAAQCLTWGADEKLLVALALGGWLYAARRPALRPISDHVLAATLLSVILPHLLKTEINQTRPDRLTVTGHWRGVPVSGRSRDAFPSGHALHMGALASVAGLLPAAPRRVLRALAATLAVSRILLLAHWASDVVAGFAIGALIERLLRPVTLRSRQQSEAGEQ